MTTADQPGEAPHHNNSVCIKFYRCKLPECRERHNNRRRAIRAGVMQPDRNLVDAEPVRQHITDLNEAGMSLTGIAHLAGVAHTTVCGFVHGRPSNRRGRQQRTTPEIAEKILAVRLLTTVGALRRIQGLATLGWPASRVAARAGLSASRVLELRPNSTILVGSAEKIATTYEVLRHLAPEKHGVHAGHADRVRARAQANRWPTPGYWAERMDVIDDQYFEPMYGITRREIIAQDANLIMRTTGGDKIAAAERLGVSKSYIEHAFRDHPQYAIEVAA